MAENQPAPADISTAEPLFAGIDVGGTNIKVGVVDDQGRTLGQRQIPTEEERGPEDAIQRTWQAIQSLMRDVSADASRLVAVGLATPGTMDIAQGKLLHPHNLPHWFEFPIQRYLEQTTGRPVAFANDANAAAFGERWVGSGREHDSVVLFTLGTGVGGGIILGDLSVDGENSAGSELGHIIIDYHPNARRCGCGQLGHLEGYASGKAVVQRASEAAEQFPDSALAEHLQSGRSLTPRDVADAAAAGDAAADQVVMDTAMYLGVGAVSLMHTVDPGAVIFGGAMNFGGHDTELGRRFLARIRQEVRERAFPVLAEKTRVDFATLGSDAGFIGAAGKARSLYQRGRA